MATVGICGTDLHVIKDEWQRPRPMVLGHEGAGIVEAVGEGVESVAEGDAVVLSWAPSCGVCPDCRRGRPAACLPLQYAIGGGTLIDGTTGMTLGGETLYRGTATGALSERLVVSERVALPLGDAASARPGGAARLRRADGGRRRALRSGRRGGLDGARDRGGRRRPVRRPGREDRRGVRDRLLRSGLRSGSSSRSGSARRASSTRTSSSERAKEHFPEGFDYAFDAVGDPETTKAAFRWTRNGGLCVIVGLPAAGARLDLDPTEFIRREKRLTGTIYGSEDPAVALPILLDHVGAGRLDLATQVGPSFSLDDVNDAIAAALGGVAGRVLVQL